MGFLLLCAAVFEGILIVFDDDQLGLQGALKLLRLPAVILCCLVAHEDGCDWLSCLHDVEDGVRGVVSIERGGRSVGVAWAMVQSGGLVVAALHLAVWLVRWCLVTMKFLIVNTDITSERNIIGWRVAELWLVK